MRDINPFRMTGPQFNGPQPTGSRQPVGFNAEPVNFSTAGGADSVNFNSYFTAQPVKDTPANVNVSALVNQVSVNGGTLSSGAMSFLQGPHPESAFVA